MWIACDHGYGHARRAVLIGSALADAGWQVELLCARQAWHRFQALGAASAKLCWKEFNTGTQPSGFREGRRPDWIDRLPGLSAYDVVVSDNLVEILNVREDAILCGSFLWHNSVVGVHPDVARRHESLLARHRPMMIGQELFVNAELARLTTLTTTGLCTMWPALPANAGEDLLIACGMSGATHDAYQRLVAGLADHADVPYRTVWVDPALLPSRRPDWMQPADYSREMYSRLKAAICRPGVGTVTDTLWAYARVFSLYEEGNEEMRFNARALREAGLGEDGSSAADVLTAALHYASDAAAIADHWRAAGRVDCRGVEQSVGAIAGSLGP